MIQALYDDDEPLLPPLRQRREGTMLDVTATTLGELKLNALDPEDETVMRLVSPIDDIPALPAAPVMDAGR